MADNGITIRYAFSVGVYDKDILDLMLQLQRFQYLVPSTVRCLSVRRTELGIKIKKEKEKEYVLRRQYREDPKVEEKIRKNTEALKAFSVEFGDDKDRFDAELFELWTKITKRIKKPNSNFKIVAANHIKMKHLAAKMLVDPAILRGPQIKYQPHMEQVLIQEFDLYRRGCPPVIWNRRHYLREKLRDLAVKLGNKYDSYYVYQREIKPHVRFAHSRNHKFFRWVYYNSETGAPYELHGKTAAQKHRWDELKAERDTHLREIELTDILHYKYVIELLGIAPIYIPTFRMPGPRFFRNTTVSVLSEGEVNRWREKRRHGAVTPEEENEGVRIPDRPTRFNETIMGWAYTDQNRYVDSDFPYGRAIQRTDPIPLAMDIVDRGNHVLEIMPPEEEQKKGMRRHL